MGWMIRQVRLVGLAFKHGQLNFFVNCKVQRIRCVTASEVGALFLKQFADYHGCHGCLTWLIDKVHVSRIKSHSGGNVHFVAARHGNYDNAM